MRRATKRIVFFIAGFFTVALIAAAIAIVILNRSGVRAWEEYRITARSSGIKLSPEDYIPAPIADADNFAATPLFADLFGEENPGDSRTAVFTLPVEGAGTKSTIGGGTRIDLAAWRDLFIRAGWIPNEAADNRIGLAILTAVKRMDKELSQLAEAETRPKCCFPVDWSRNVAALQPHLDVLLQASKVRRLQTAALLSEGRNQEALAAVRSLTRMVMTLEYEPTLIVGLVRSAIASQLGWAVREGLIEHRWMPAEIDAIDAALVPVDLLEGWRFAASSERAMQNALINDLVTARKKVGEILPDESEPDVLGINDDTSSLRFGKLLNHFGKGWLRANQTSFNREIDTLLARLGPERGSWHGERNVASAPNEQDSPFLGRYYAAHRRFTGVYPVVQEKMLQAEVIVRQTRMALALERFHQKTNQFPGELAELVPTFINAMPLDLMNGDSFHYRRTDSGYLLWSVGVNRRDDNAKIDSRKSDRHQLDWVWSMPPED